MAAQRRITAADDDKILTGLLGNSRYPLCYRLMYFCRVLAGESPGVSQYIKFRIGFVKPLGQGSFRPFRIYGNIVHCLCSRRIIIENDDFFMEFL